MNLQIRWRNATTILALLALVLSTLALSIGMAPEATATTPDGKAVTQSSIDFTPDEVTNWSPDRQEPSAGWGSVSYAGRDDVLQIGIDSADAATGSFYRTEGVTTPTGVPTTEVEVDLYLDSAWEDNAVRAGIWTVGYDSAGENRSQAFGIIEFVSAEYDSDAETYSQNETWRVWTSGLGWTELPDVPFTYGEWVTLSIRLDLDSQTYHFSIADEVVASQDIPVGTEGISESFGLGELFINSYNFGNDVMEGELSNDSYAAHWHGMELVNTFSSIQAAVDSLESGGSVSVGSGTFTENVVLNQDGLQLIGAGSDATVIAPTSGHAISIPGHTAGEIDGVSITGFELAPDSGFGLIALSGTVDVAPTTLNLAVEDVVTDSQIVLNAVEGADFTEVTITDTTGSGGSGGLELTGVSDLTISDSTFTGNTIGIRLQSTDGLVPASAYGTNGDVTITDTVFTDNTVAIDNGDGDVEVAATNNWWGCSEGSGASECDSTTGAVDTSSPLSAEIASVTAPSSVSHSTTSVTPTVALANDRHVSVNVTGNTNLNEGNNTITVTSTLTVAGVTLDTDTAQVTVRRSAPPAPPEPTPQPTASETVAPGGSVTAENDGASTQVTSPNGGTVEVSVDRTPTDTEPANGFSFLDFTVDITAPDATPEEPLVLDFKLDPEIASDLDPSQLVIFRNGVPVPLCTGPTGIAEPDPCVAGFSGVESGELQFQVLTSQASVWTVAEVTNACPTLLVPDAGFTDTAGSVHQSAIDCLAWWGVTQGVDADHFAPGRDVTRGQMASFLHRLLDAAQIDLPTPIDYGFRDVGADETHRDSINQMAVTGVLDGYRDGSFKPDASITRAQMATMIVGAFEYATQVELEVGDVPFNDVHGVHAENIARAFNAGLLNGTTGSTFDPASSTTRAQMATALTHMLDELVERHLAELPR